MTTENNPTAVADTHPVKFPLDFKKCPVCGSSKRVIEECFKNESPALRRMATEGRVALIQFTGQITDVRVPLIGLPVPVVVFNFDVCADCGCFYCIGADKTIGVNQIRKK